MANNETITVDRARRLFKEIAELSQEASMTGILEEGVGRAIARYNALLQECISAGLLPQGVYAPLPDNARYGELGVEARLAMASLENGNGANRGNGGPRNRDVDFGAIVRIAPFVGSEALGELIREQIRSGVNIGMDALTAVAPFLGEDMVSALVREHLNAPAAPEPPAPPTPPTPPEPPTQVTTHPVPIAEPHPVSSANLPEVAPNEELQTLAARLADPDLSAEERSKIAIRLSELALHQGQIAREG